MRKTIGLIAILLVSSSTTATAGNNVYVKLSCENNTTVDITLKQQEQVGWLTCLPQTERGGLSSSWEQRMIRGLIV